MNSSRTWLFRGLVLIATALLLTSWFLPWWGVDIEEVALNNAVVVHPWGLTNNLGMYDYLMKGIGMPGWFTPFMWAYLGLVIVALLVGIWSKDKNIRLFNRELNLSRWLVGIVGFSYVVVVIAAVLAIYLNIQSSDYSFALVGRTYVDKSDFEYSWVNTHLMIGYWLACGVGPLLLVLALFRNKILGAKAN